MVERDRNSQMAPLVWSFVLDFVTRQKYLLLISDAATTLPLVTHSVRVTIFIADENAPGITRPVSSSRHLITNNVRGDNPGSTVITV